MTDRVKVVYCKDCKFCEVNDLGFSFCRLHPPFATTALGYCWLGVRKDDVCSSKSDSEVVDDE